MHVENVCRRTGLGMLHNDNFMMLKFFFYFQSYEDMFQHTIIKYNGILNPITIFLYM